MSKLKIHTVTGNGNSFGDGNIIINSTSGTNSGTPIPMLSSMVHKIRFDNFSGQEFERLVYAYLTKIKLYDRLEWLGEVGSDGGRDLWGFSAGKSYCFACANYQRLSMRKCEGDISSLVRNGTIPDRLVIVCGGSISAPLREKVKKYAINNGFAAVELWSGVEFEEKLRTDAPEVLKRFVCGDPFPESEAKGDLRTTGQTTDDTQILDQLLECFDRPAFTVRYCQESNIPDFEKAITDTIEVLNTGLHRLRDGTFIRQIQPRHRLKDERLKKLLGEVATLVVQLRDEISRLRRTHDFRSCECGNPACPTKFFSQEACTILEGMRQKIFERLRQASPSFNLAIR